MESKQFDHIATTFARSLSETPSRRRALGLLASSVLGGLLALGALPSEAKKGGKGKGKKGKDKKKKRDGGQPPPCPDDCCADADCGLGQLCRNGACFHGCADASICSPLLPVRCDRAGVLCACVATEGAAVCAAVPDLSCEALIGLACNSDADCPPHRVCTPTCCPEQGDPGPAKACLAACPD